MSSKNCSPLREQLPIAIENVILLQLVYRTHFRYLNFARMFKPKLSFDSQELLVQQYKHLRQRDTGGSAKSSWRITVRQLESMLRLSEAFARLHCSDTVSKKHVQEAYRLLNKSIIRYVRLFILNQ